jgi:hypothetical protein
MCTVLSISTNNPHHIQISFIKRMYVCVEFMLQIHNCKLLLLLLLFYVLFNSGVSATRVTYHRMIYKGNYELVGMRCCGVFKNIR